MRLKIEHIPHNVWMSQILKQRDFANRIRGNPFALRLQPDALQRDDGVRPAVLGLVHLSVGALTDLLQTLVPLHCQTLQQVDRTD